MFNRSRFNILQFAHLLWPLLYHGTHCHRLEEFTTCWNMLQDICGSKVRGLEQHAILLVEGCKIQSAMDLAGCHWQDMLLPHYIQASRVTQWPLGTQCLQNPMALEKYVYNADITEDLKKVIALLQPGLEEISQKCGSQLSTRLRVLLQKLHYLQYDAFNYIALLYRYI